MDEGTKRQRGESPPSKVIHCRGLPTFATENELVALAHSFGEVVRVLVLASKQQAFIQFSTLDAATAFLNHYNQNPVQIRNKTVYFGYSNRTEVVKTTDTTVLQRGLQGAESGSGGSGGGEPNSILLVSVLNAQVPVTLDNMLSIFQPYGDVLKILTFLKNGVFKALVQMGTVEQALNAKLMLQGKDMFQGCCHLQINFSTLSELNIKKSGPSARDFTQGDAPGGAGGYGGVANSAMFGQMGMGQGQALSSHPSFEQKVYGYSEPNPRQQMGGQQMAGCVILVSNIPEEFATPDTLFTLFGVYGDVLRVKVLFKKPDTALIQFVSPDQAHQAIANLNKLALHENELSISPSKHMEIAMPRDNSLDPSNLTKDFSASKIKRFRNPGGKNSKNINPPSTILHVSNLPEDCPQDQLQELFDAEVVQFFAKSHKMAFVKMGSVLSAIQALVRLHNHQMYDGRHIRVSFSPKDPATVTGIDHTPTGPE